MRVLRDQAAVDNSAGRPVQAQRALRAALEAIDRVGAGVPRDDLLAVRCKTLTTLALTDFLLSGLAAAELRFDEASRVVAELGDADLGARVAYQRANVYGRAGDLASASAGIEAALARLAAFTPVEQCSVFLSRGMLALETGEPELALESFHEAAGLSGAHGFVAEAQMSRHNEGYARYLLGDLPGALTTMAAAAELDTDFSSATPLLDRGRVLLEAGLVSEAIDVLRTGTASIAGPPGDGQDQLRAEFDLELAKGEQLRGHRDLASAAAERARAAFARLGATAWAGRASLAGLLADLDHQGRHRDSAGAVRVARRTARRADALVGTATALGDLHLADNARVAAAAALFLAGDLTAAQAQLSARIGPPVSLSDELNVSGVTAAILSARGEAGRARRLLSRAARRLEAGQQGSASLDVRTARAIHGTWLSVLDLRLAHGAPAVLATLERWRSATDRLPSLGRPDDEELADLTERLRLVYARIRAEGRPEPQLERDADWLQRQIRARDWALSARTETATQTPLRIREAREALGAADRDLVWLFGMANRLWGVGIVRGRAVLRELMALERAVELAQRIRADLRAAATQHLGELRSAVWGSLHSAATELDDALMRPWRLDAAGLVLVTCQEVSALPWALLPSLVGRPLTVARSLTAFARRDDGLGRPVPHHRHVRRVHISVGPALSRARAEAGAIAATWGEAAVVVEPSRARLLVDALAAPGVVHVAAHGTHEVQSPLFSSVALHDGPVFAHELQPTGVRADHVVLSACDVGVASFRPGEESLGLAASVLSLGARSVVAAVSPVPDAVAADAMVAHHRALAKGCSSDIALAEAIVATDPVTAAFLNLGGRFVP
ncbi:MAG: CHAT domain-containing protein [Intrasporangium sp.]|uniref:CHAT domain-containing protein n=1 Tax=Intrasporangium sp. TaxID=1925024 RepID=UPI002647E9EC|nr:CHAT domain-containing protein [Intrasporangium sp.]MDN5797879.1 CHAT domain-containing protein [Intrasporangium sp.]